MRYINAHFWIIISAHCTYSLYFILWIFAHPLVIPRSIFYTFRPFCFKHCTAVFILKIYFRYFLYIFHIYFQFMIIDFWSTLCFIFSHYVYCYAPKYQGKFPGCDFLGLLGSKPDSDFDSGSSRVLLHKSIMLRKLGKINVDSEKSNIIRMFISCNKPVGLLL